MKKDEAYKELYEEAEYEVALEDSLYEFVKGAWPEVDPNKFEETPHIKTICDHLQLVKERKINRLIINIPPGFCKSLISCVFFPAWIWTTQPEHRFLTGSYAAELAIRDTRKARQLIESKWYKYFWAEKYKLSSDQNQKSLYFNNRNGYRVAFSTGGAITGHRADTIILDDPLNWKDRYSKSIRDGVNESITGGLFPRLNDQRTGVIIVIMQRLHAQDATGYLLDRGEWTHLCLPMEFDPKRRCKTSIYKDVRKKGQILWDRYSKKIVSNLKVNLGSETYSAQYQQLPYQDEGQIIKRDWWQYYREQPNFKLVLQSWDTAFKKDTQNDYSVCTTWGQTDTGFYLLDRWKERVEFPELKRAVVALAAKYKPNQVLIEDHASGQSLIQELKRETVIPIKPIRVERDKITRTHAVAPLIEAGKVFVPDSSSWLIDYIDNLAGFPNMEHDDEVDSTTMALNYLNNMYREPSLRAL